MVGFSYCSFAVDSLTSNNVDQHWQLCLQQAPLHPLLLCTGGFPQLHAEVIDGHVGKGIAMHDIYR